MGDMIAMLVVVEGDGTTILGRAEVPEGKGARSTEPRLNSGTERGRRGNDGSCKSFFTSRAGLGISLLMVIILCSDAHGYSASNFAMMFVTN